MHVPQITELVKQGHYQLACGRFFEARHKSEIKFAPQHPNQYYEESRKLLAEDREGQFLLFCLLLYTHAPFFAPTFQVNLGQLVIPQTINLH